jgi:hypothetical protein
LVASARKRVTHSLERTIIVKSDPALHQDQFGIN